MISVPVPVPRPGLLEEYQKYLAACDEYNRLARQGEVDNHFLPGRLAEARCAPRCEHIRAGGLRCQAPALRGRTLCYAHTRMAACKEAGLLLPALEDAGGVALASMQIVQHLLDGKLDRKTAAVALYGIQIVASTLSHKPFSAPPTDVVLEAAGLPPENDLPAPPKAGPVAVQETGAPAGSAEEPPAGPPKKPPESEHDANAQRRGG